MCEEIEFRIIVLGEILVPIEMIRVEIGEYSVMSIESPNMVRHKTRYFEDYMPLFFSLLLYFEEHISQWSAKITAEIYSYIRKTCFEEMVKNG